MNNEGSDRHRTIAWFDDYHNISCNITHPVSTHDCTHNTQYTHWHSHTGTRRTCGGNRQSTLGHSDDNSTIRQTTLEFTTTTSWPDGVHPPGEIGVADNWLHCATGTRISLQKRREYNLQRRPPTRTNRRAPVVVPTDTNRRRSAAASSI